MKDPGAMIRIVPSWWLIQRKNNKLNDVTDKTNITIDLKTLIFDARFYKNGQSRFLSNL